jgi:hypothetical protein
MIELGDHWHSLESARECPDHCLSPEIIRNLEESERRGPTPQCSRSPCPWLARPGPVCTVAPGVCKRLWLEGHSWSHPRSRHAFFEHIGTFHHEWWSHPSWETVHPA